MIKVYQVFESYPLFYQPYIKKALQGLKEFSELDNKIVSYKCNDKTNHEIEILPSYYRRKAYCKLKSIFNPNLKYLNYLEIRALEENVDIIHIQHSFLFPKVITLLALNKPNKPKIVITLRGGDTYIKPFISNKWSDFYKNFSTSIAAFVVMSEHQKKFLIQWGVPDNKIRIIPISFGYPFEIKPKRPNNKKMKIYSVFRMCWEKNIYSCLTLIKKLQERGVNVSYDLYGDGPDLGQVYYLARELEIENAVTIHGKVENEQLKAQISDYDFGLQLSLSESLGMAVIEGQTLGIPYLVSDVGGLPEIIQDNHTGIVIPEINDRILERIVQLWENPEKYHQFSKNAIRIAQEKFNTSSEVDKLFQLYQDIVFKN
jgi:glycosyltransferase involved in cell wall biosynthesis